MSDHAKRVAKLVSDALATNAEVMSPADVRELREKERHKHRLDDAAHHAVRSHRDRDLDLVESMGGPDAVGAADVLARVYPTKRVTPAMVGRREPVLPEDAPQELLRRIRELESKLKAKEDQ